MWPSSTCLTFFQAELSSTLTTTQLYIWNWPRKRVPGTTYDTHFTPPTVIHAVIMAHMRITVTMYTISPCTSRYSIMLRTSHYTSFDCVDNNYRGMLQQHTWIFYPRFMVAIKTRYPIIILMISIFIHCQMASDLMEYIEIFFLSSAYSTLCVQYTHIVPVYSTYAYCLHMYVCTCYTLATWVYCLLRQFSPPAILETSQVLGKKNNYWWSILDTASGLCVLSVAGTVIQGNHISLQW